MTSAISEEQQPEVIEVGLQESVEPRVAAGADSGSSRDLSRRGINGLI